MRQAENSLHEKVISLFYLECKLQFEFVICPTVRQKNENIENDSKAESYTQVNHISTLQLTRGMVQKILHWLKQNESDFIKFCGWRVNWLN